MVLIMMIGLSLSAVYSHLSYRGIISRLEFTVDRCPRKPELDQALVQLKQPFVRRLTPLKPSRQRQEFLKVLAAARATTDEFLQNLEMLPPSADIDLALKPLGQSAAREVASQLVLLENQTQRLVQPEKWVKEVEHIREQLDALQVFAAQIPDFQRGIPGTIQEAGTVFRRGFWLVIGSGAVAVLFLCGLIIYGYHWVFAPLRKLHQGALRVAQGDFNYRLELSRQDEMQELADAFNSMTSRFQEIRGDLDRQVCERIKQLIRSERLAGIGLLAAGVAHEINNPLSAIAMAAESLTDRLSDPDSGTQAENAEITRQYLQMIQREAFRCQRITQKLLDFARGNADACTRHDLTAIVNDVLGVVRHMSRYGDRAIRFTRNTPCYLEINGPEIQQVVMNLVSNGLEAMESGGTMTIAITEQTDQVTLSVTDDGCGMTSEVIDNLFEPFFTQRRNGRGTGLGLSISHRIICDHGGAIEVESAGPGKGSTFRVRLPRRAAKRQAAA